jgi:hypothetical protein
VTVRVDIGANAGNVTAAVSGVKDAIRAAAAEARAFADIDMGHGELAKFEADIQRLTRALNTLR